MQRKSAATFTPSLGFHTTIETFQMMYCMMFYLKGHQNCQKSNLKAQKNVPFYLVNYTSLDHYLLAVLMPIEIKHHTVSHLKGLNNGLEP